jgi:hypothetical protein
MWPEHWSPKHTPVKRFSKSTAKAQPKRSQHGDAWARKRSRVHEFEIQAEGPKTEKRHMNVRMQKRVDRKCSKIKQVFYLGFIIHVNHFNVVISFGDLWIGLQRQTLHTIKFTPKRKRPTKTHKETKQTKTKTQQTKTSATATDENQMSCPCMCERCSVFDLGCK